MSFDKPTRKALARMVGHARDRLSGDAMDQLLRLGFQADGTVLDLDRIDGLSEEERAAGKELLQLLEHRISSESGSEAARRHNGYHRMVREIGFTSFNRLVALRMAEERGLLVQSVSAGFASAGFRIFDSVAAGALGGRLECYRAYLEGLYDEIAMDLPALFDRASPESFLFPSEHALEDVFSLMNDPALARLWKEDEAIGWVYQYYNDPNERKKMREASSTPRNSRELAVRNQFFTPRYVVEFLTDNTLGRTWYEMRKGETSLVDSCRYMVRRPHAIFLKSGQPTPAPWPKSEWAVEALDSDSPGQMWVQPDPEQHDIDYIFRYALTVSGYQYAKERWGIECGDLANRKAKDRAETEQWTGGFEELRCCLFFEQRRWHHFGDLPEGDPLAAIQALYRSICDRWDREVEVIAHRERQNPREIRVLDPACGSGHFLLYAYDLLETIYQEAYEDAALEPELRRDYPDSERFRRALPALILRHNLHGIDIDPRACQIAGLALWLRAQRAYQDAGLKPEERPPIRKSNIVCAEPMPGEKEMLEEYVRELDPRLRPLVRTVWEKMQLAGEAGSLLKIEEDIDEVLKNYRRDALVDKPSLPAPFLERERPQQLALVADSDFEAASFWRRAEVELLVALRDYAGRVANGRGSRRRMFRDDAEQGFAFIDLCRQQFDVVLMNPPFGEANRKSADYVEGSYASLKSEIMACFVQRAMGWLRKQGSVGAITSRTILFNAACEDLRREWFHQNGQLGAIADLGYGILDSAMVEAVCFCAKRGTAFSNCTTSSFIRLLRSVEKESYLRALIGKCSAGEIADDLFHRRSQDFFDIFRFPFAYWLPKSLLAIFKNQPALEPGLGAVRVGLSTADNFRFLRLSWEVPRSLIARSKLETFAGKRWVALAKGGEYAPLYDDIHLMIDWADGGDEVRAFEGATIRSSDSYFSVGATFPYRTTSAFSLRVLPEGSIFSDGGQAVLPIEGGKHRALALIAYFNTRIARQFLEVFLGEGDAVVSGSAARNYVPRAIGAVPVPEEIDTLVSRFPVQAWMDYALRIPAADETSRLYSVPRLLLVTSNSLKDAFAQVETHEGNAQIDALQETLRFEQGVVQALGLTQNDVDVINSEFGRHPAEFPTRQPNRKRLQELMSMNTGMLVDTATEELGASRFVTKKMYYTDRALELQCRLLQSSPSSIVRAKADIGFVAPDRLRYDIAAILSHCVGCAFGRWDVRIAHDPTLAPKLTDVFAPLPVCPPGMLVGPDGLPALPGGVVSEQWFRAWPAAITPPPEGSVHRTNISDSEYPILMSWGGILVDDLSHQDDLVRRVREVLAVLRKELAEGIEQEACQILGVRGLREYLSKPCNFFADHLKRYSKSRRQAPIYWPLSTASGSYTLWVYYHRLTSDTLYTAVNQYVDPKIDQTKRTLNELEANLAGTLGREATGTRSQIEETKAFISELAELRQELMRVAALPYRPDLNDGVIINAAPLHRLFRLPKWAKDTKECWEKLKKGEYDWAHMAFNMWPDRVGEKCRSDKSLAIAHGLEELYVEPPVAAKKRGKRAMSTAEEGEEE